MRYQYAGRLQENDHVYLFIAPGYSGLIDRLFASKAPVSESDEAFFGTFQIAPNRPVEEVLQAYGPMTATEAEADMTVGELIEHRIGGKAHYGDRVRLHNIVLIVVDTDENGRISKVGVSMEPVAPATSLPIFLDLPEIRSRIRDYVAKRKRLRSIRQASGEPEQKEV